ncbi:LADA_0H08196g1_1 [Lachancea dasiensis]|uniref:LADA_0H08196g1_1 n=1 Tax=Lachancea dasiensis TaxID=1072105 RepID=A0A1G4K2N3_9SACH|nr:LADA_0H08196g1_1 [Lachancea dasiensis]
MVLAVLSTLISCVLAHAGHSHGGKAGVESSLTAVLSKHLFPYSARYNALLATAYISIAPCVIVSVIPAFRKSQKSMFLSLMVAFAFGTLFGDILLHLLPAIFTVNGEGIDLGGLPQAIAQLPQFDATHEIASDLLSALEPHSWKLGAGDQDPMRHTVLGVLMFIGFLLFMAIDKTFRLINFGSPQETGVHGHTHGHSHSHSHLPVPELKSQTPSDDSPDAVKSEVQTSASLKTSAYLSLVSAFAHNLTDGFALASSFYKSRSTGVVTTVAVLVHEIPHELGDFAILLASGLTFSGALKFQSMGALGALMGTMCGCLANELSFNGCTATAVGPGVLWGVSAADAMLPITTGGLLFISTVGIVPELLNTSAETKNQELAYTGLQLISVLLGFALMAWMSLNE